MASPLTASSIKSGFLYFVLLSIIISGVFYLFLFSEPNVVNNLNKHAFRLNSSAFENGIRFANIRFLTNNPQKNTIDQWLVENKGLDFNSKGFPIGTDIVEPGVEQTKTVEHCRQVWQFVLGPLQPDLYLSLNKDGYWVELDQQNFCIYRPYQLDKMQLSYHSLTGKVVLSE